MKIYELVLPEDEDAQIEEISLVESPAIERNFHSFSKDAKQTFKQADKQIVIGPALIPGMLIPRVDPLTGEEYQVFFRAKGVERIAYSFTASRDKLFKLEHSEDLSGIEMFESWIITDPVRDKSRQFGFSFPVGTWMVMLKIKNADIWQNFVKTGLVKGFSIGGNFDYIERQRVLASANNNNNIKNNYKMTKDNYKDVIAKAVEAALGVVADQFSYDEKKDEEKLAEGSVLIKLPMEEVSFDPAVGFETELEDADGNKYLLSIKPLAAEDPQNADESGAPLESIADLAKEDEKKKKDQEEMSKLKAENEKFKQLLSQKTVVKETNKTAEGFSVAKELDLESFISSKVKTPVKRK